MGDNHRICQICHVEEKYCSEKLFFARFPLDENRCKQWVKLVGIEDLVHLPIEKLHDLRYVCGKHFAKCDFTKIKTRLKKRAVPKLGLTLPPLSDALLEGFPLHIARPRPIEADIVLCINHDHCYGQDLPGSVQEPAIQTTQHAVNADTSSATLGLVKCTDAASHLSHDLQTNMQPTAPSTSRQPDVTSILPNVVPSTSMLSEVQPDIKKMNIDLQSLPDNPKVMGTKNPTGNTIGTTSSFTGEQGAQGLKRKLSDDTTELTPRKKKLVKELKKTKCTLRSLRKSATLIEKIGSPVLKEIVLNAAKNQSRKPKGRRWTIKNKISALAIFKRSPKTYRYLGQVLPLPSPRTLQNILKKVPMEPGINNTVLQHLKKIAPEKNDKQKVCCLLFDEMAIKPRLILNPTNDCVEGYEDLGELGRKNEVADHALVFMLQGMYQKYKQPIAFYFTKGTISSPNLANIIKKIITEVKGCGFKIINTVCDQGPTNLGAIKLLRDSSGPREDGSNHYFRHEGDKIYIVFDVPHLFKSLRNNFLNHGTIEIAGKKGEWVHLLEVERENRNFLYLSKITQAHINPKYKTKMRVKYAAQILSNTVSAVLKLLSRAETNSDKKEKLMRTAEVISDLDTLFDASNGPSGPSDKKRGKRENVSRKTNHLNTWASYIQKLKTIKFIGRNGNPAKNVKCVEGYITTLKSLRDIWQDVQVLGFKYLNLRQVNQDALENLFGLIRQHSPTNKNPTAAHFIAALKTAIISKMNAPQITGANCEMDKNFLLSNLQENDEIYEKDEEEEDKVRNKENKENDDEFPTISIPEIEDEDIEENLITTSGQAVVYLSGYIASRLLKNNTCDECKQCLSIENPQQNPMYSYTLLREWWQHKLSLTYPTVNLCKLVQTATNVAENEITNILHEKNIIQITITLFEVHCEFAWFTCKTHAKTLLRVIFTKLALILIRRACQKINIKYASAEMPLADAVKKAQQVGKDK